MISKSFLFWGDLLLLGRLFGVFLCLSSHFYLLSNLFIFTKYIEIKRINQISFCFINAMSKY